MTERSQAAVVLLSGGVDSAASAFLLRERGLKVEGLFVDYGQAAAAREARAAESVSNHLQIPLRRINVDGSMQFEPGEMIGRNAFLVFTALFATRGMAGVVGIGLHDGTPYYDCSEMFLKGLSKLVAEHTDGRVSVVAPFIHWTKMDVFDYFSTTRIPLHCTYSCEAGTEPVCGVCASCRDREALRC